MSIEDTVPEHAVIHIFSGSMTITDATKTYTANEGDTFKMKKSQIFCRWCC